MPGSRRSYIDPRRLIGLPRKKPGHVDLPVGKQTCRICHKAFLSSDNEPLLQKIPFLDPQTMRDADELCPRHFAVEYNVKARFHPLVEAAFEVSAGIEVKIQDATGKWTLRAWIYEYRKAMFLVKDELDRKFWLTIDQIKPATARDKKKLWELRKETNSLTTMPPDNYPGFRGPADDPRRSIAGAGTLMVYSSIPYFSRTKNRGLDPECDKAQDLVQAVKDGDPKSLKVGARVLARHPQLRGFHGIVTAAPRSKAGRPSNMKMAEELVNLGIGDQAIQMVERIKPVESSRLRRRQGLPGVTVTEHIESMAFIGQPSDTPVLIIDDVFTTGSTIKAVVAHIRKAGHTGTISAATVGYFVDDTKLSKTCPVQHTMLQA